MIKLMVAAACLFSCTAKNTMKQAKEIVQASVKPANDIYQFKVEGIEGDMIDFASFKGKKILIVNTASECGFTPQYKELEELSIKYQGKLVVIGFPTNNFGGQEPGNNQEIKTFCQRNYGVTFLMASKISVKGADIAPIYQWLTSKEQNGFLDTEVKWNFNKFLIDENGKLIAYFPSKVAPMSEQITGKLI